MFKFLEKKKPQNSIYYLVKNKSVITNTEIRWIHDWKKHFEYLVKSGRPLLHEGYYVVNQNAFNTYLIDFNVDLLYCDKDGKVIYIRNHLKPNQLTSPINGAKFIYVLPDGFISKNKIVLENRISKKWVRNIH